MTATAKAVDAELKWLRKYVSENHGAIPGIVARLTKMAGKKQYAANVWSWLTTDETKQSEPRFGIGIMLVRIQNDIKSGKWSPIDA